MLNTKMIGNKITEARRKINITQSQLAQQLFISSQAVGKWERGESMPDITTFDRLAEILGVDLNYFSENFQSATPLSAANEPQQKNSNDHETSKPKIKLSWDMSGSNWVDADFSGLKNLHEKFGSSNMKNCRFVGSNLSGLLLKSNNVDACNFSDSDLSHSHFQRSNIANSMFNACSLKDTEFSQSNISGCDFTGADFTGTIVKHSNFMTNKLTNAIWKQSSFIGMHIDDTVFDGIFENCYFENCSFHRVTFRNAKLINNFFKNNKNLKRIRFIDCEADQMTYAFLKNGKADLNGITVLPAS